MPVDAKRDQKLEQIKSLALGFDQSTPKQLATRQDGQNILVLEQVDLPLSSCLRLVKECSKRDLLEISNQQVDELRNAFQSLRKWIDSVQNLSVDNAELAKHRNTLRDDIWNIHSNIADCTAKVLAITDLQAGKTEDAIRRLSALEGEWTEKQQSSLALLQQMGFKAEHLLSSIRETTAHAGVAQTSEAFLAEATKHATSARLWFWMTIIFLITTLVVAWLSFDFSLKFTPSSTAQAIQLGVAKVVGISILSFALVWSSRNYRSHKHNETINRHRMNALQTFQAFMGGSAEPNTKNAILAAAAGAAFSPTPTGFDQQAPESGATALQMLSIVDRVTKQTAPSGAA